MHTKVKKEEETVDFGKVKRYIFLVFCFFLSSLFCSVPTELLGLWEGKDRFIYFEEDGCAAIVYKLYYGLYFDRACEKKEWSEKKKRDRNLASFSKVLPLKVDFLPKRDGVWEVKVFGKGREENEVPLALIDGKLYFSFLLKEKTKDDEFWTEVNAASHFGLSKGHKKENLFGWYITGNDVYRIRYWKSDVAFNDEMKALFYAGEKEFEVRKQIFSGGSVFQSAPLKASVIANVKHYDVFPFKDFAKSEEACAESEEGFTKVTDVKEVNDFLSLIEKHNSLPPPPLPPVFPQSKE